MCVFASSFRVLPVGLSFSMSLRVPAPSEDLPGPPFDPPSGKVLPVYGVRICPIGFGWQFREFESKKLGLFRLNAGSFCQMALASVVVAVSQVTRQDLGVPAILNIPDSAGYPTGDSSV